MWSKIPNWLKNKYAITIVIFIVWLSFFDQNNFLVQYDFKKELRTLEQDKAFYLEEIKKTRTELNELTTNPVTLEKFAREKYLMKKDNEEIFVFELEKRIKPHLSYAYFHCFNYLCYDYKVYYMNLFKDFKPVSHQEWLDKINQDLKGKDFIETLVWNTDEDIDVQPFYNAESLKDNLSQGFNLTNNANDWEIREQIEIKAIKEANKLALNALKKLEQTAYNLMAILIAKKEMNELLAGIILDLIHIHFYTPTPEQTFNFFTTFVESNNIEKSTLKGSISYDYLGELLISGNWKTDEKADFSALFNIQNKTNLNTITIRGDYYTNAGATSAQEIAYAASQAVEYIHQLSELGITPEKVMNNITFNLGVNSNYFFEIAKIRAFKILWSLVTKEYGVNNVSPYIHAQTTIYNIAAQDAQTNILRTTTEGMSAVLGGCNSLSITPFNFAYENPSDFTLRVARNIQIIIKEEAYLNKVNDIAKGSYYIEHLTDELVAKSLTLFKEIEVNGGFLTNIKNSTIQNNIHSVNANKETAYRNGSRFLLGVNIHINKMETPQNCNLHLEPSDKKTSINRLQQVNIPQKLTQQKAVNA